MVSTRKQTRIREEKLKKEREILRGLKAKFDLKECRVVMNKHVAKKQSFQSKSGSKPNLEDMMVEIQNKPK